MEKAKFAETHFPPFEAFCNSLGNKVFKSDYKEGKKFFDANCNTFRDYHDIYLSQDVLVILNTLLKFKEDLFSLDGLDLVRDVSLPQY